MRHEFVQEQPVPIDSGLPNAIVSEVDVVGLDGATVEEVEVTLDVSHTWVGDLVVTLADPGGNDVVLVEREGGALNDFHGTVFRADAVLSIEDALPPYRGTFRPEGDLTELEGVSANGTWTLRIEDRAFRDGGMLNRWVLGLSTNAVEPAGFDVEVRFLGGLTPAQQSAFATAATRWSEVIVGDVPPVDLNGELIDDILIDAQGVAIDGPGQVLGQAGPTHIRPGSNLPIKGIMSFDTADLDRMEDDGSLEDVILHEMAHVLGFGTLWTAQFMDLIDGEGSVNPTFTGIRAKAEYGRLAEHGQPTPVPVANTGGAGTRDGHWREAVFGDELLTGFLSGSSRPLSLMSVACFDDMGYRVADTAADPYLLPSTLRLAEIGLLGDRHDVDTCRVERVTPVVVPATSVVNQPN